MAEKFDIAMLPLVASFLDRKLSELIVWTAQIKRNTPGVVRSAIPATIRFVVTLPSYGLSAA